MSVKNFAQQMKITIEDIKSKGTAAIYCDNIIAYLNEVLKSPEPEPTLADVEKYKANLQNWIETNKRAHEEQLEMFRSVITAGQNAIKTSFYLNGGAAVALLAFIAHLVEVGKEKIPEFGCHLLPFAFGVLAITVTSGLTYLSQWLYANSKPITRQWGFRVNMCCIALGLLSYIFFVWGLISVNSSFHRF